MYVEKVKQSVYLEILQCLKADDIQDNRSIAIYVPQAVISKLEHD